MRVPTTKQRDLITSINKFIEVSGWSMAKLQRAIGLRSTSTLSEFLSGTSGVSINNYNAIVDFLRAYQVIQDVDLGVHGIEDFLEVKEGKKKFRNDKFTDLLNREGVTDEGFAILIGTNVQNIRNWKSGETQPTLENFIKIIEVFEVEVEQVYY